MSYRKWYSLCKKVPLLKIIHFLFSSMQSEILSYYTIQLKSSDIKWTTTQLLKPLYVYIDNIDSKQIQLADVSTDVHVYLK